MSARHQAASSSAPRFSLTFFRTQIKLLFRPGRKASFPLTILSQGSLHELDRFAPL